ncbi:MAG: KilA-N domain-containing protein [Bacteroidota bacterium]
MAKKTITVEGFEIALLPRPKAEDYISLSDIMRKFDDEFAVYGWMRNKNTVEFLGVWEQLNNPGFNSNEFVRIKNEAGANAFNLTPKKWAEATGAIGITSKTGRYGSGIFAHRDIAVNFCSWLSPTFQLYLIQEFQRLKEQESKSAREALGWDVRRLLSKVNYHLHTDAVRTNLVPLIDWHSRREKFYFASEADVLNVAVFGVTAQQWRLANPDAKGNMRDHASPEQLIILANLEAINAELIREGLSQDERAAKLNEIAIYQMQILTNLPTLKQLPEKKG